MRRAAQPLSPPQEGDPVRRRMAALIADASIEVRPRDEMAGAPLRDWFAAGTAVFVAFPGSVTHHDIVAACARLRRAGFTPVPHVAVRRLAGFSQAADFLRRAVGEAAVDRILLIGGDPDRPVGPFEDSLSLLASGVVESHGIRRIAFAGHPAGHPRVAARTLDEALRGKLAEARRRGLDAEIVTQFGFEPAPIARWIGRLRDAGIDCPVRIGVAGPASVATLAKYAVRCGIGGSLRSLARGHAAAAFARILTEASPDRLITALVAERDAAVPLDGLHIFTFGGVRRTAMWADAHR